MNSFLLITCLLVSGSVAIDFTTIGQKEIVDYIKNRADLLHGKKLTERNLQDLLSNAVFTGLEEEALIFAYGTSTDESVKADNPTARLAVLAASPDTAKSVPLHIVLTSDTLGSTNIASAGITTTKSSSTKSSSGDFLVNCVQQTDFDFTSLDGLINVDLGGATDSHNLTLTKTIYLAAQVNVTSLGSKWDSSSSPLLTNEGKLLSLLDSRKGSMFIVTYESLIRETIKAEEGDLFGGLKSSGKVLVVVDEKGVVSLSGRTVSGKILATWTNEAEEHVDQFLTINGSKSRQLMVSNIADARSIIFDHRKGKLVSKSQVSNRHNHRDSQKRIIELLKQIVNELDADLNECEDSCENGATSTTQSPVSTKTKTPPISVTTKKPPVSTTTKPPATTKKPAVSTTTKKPPVPTTTKKSPVATTTKKPAVSSTTKKPPATTTKKPPTATTKKPSVPTTTKKPPVSTTTKKPPTAATTKKPAVATTTKKPAIATTKKPTVPTTTKKPPVATTAKPAVSTTTKKPSVTTKKPPVSVTTKKPPVTTTKKPVTSTSTKKPPVVTTTKKPPVSTTKKPIMSTTVKPMIPSTTKLPQVSTTPKPKPIEPKPDLSEPDFTKLPRGTTIFRWTAQIN